MEKIQVKEELKQEYLGLVRGAQTMEQSLGAAEYRVYKMKQQREQVDVDLKTWWDKVAEEHKLDKAQDYYVDNAGDINLVEKQPKESADTPVPTAPAVDPDNKEGGTSEDLT